MKQKIVMQKKFTTFLLIYFVLFISYFSVITLSKYVGKINRPSSIAIAKWDVSLDTSDNSSNVLNMTIGDTNTTPSYILKITSISDTKASYSIVLSDLPDGLEVKLDNGNYQTQVNNTITFENVGYINVNDETKTKVHTLTFFVPIDSDTITESEFNVDVVFNQVSPIAN